MYGQTVSEIFFESVQILWFMVLLIGDYISALANLYKLPLYKSGRSPVNRHF